MALFYRYKNLKKFPIYKSNKYPFINELTN